MARANPMPAASQGRTGFLVAAVLALMTGVLIFAALKQAGRGDSSPAVPAAPVSVVVAKQDIPARTTITLDMVEVATVPSETLLSGALGAADLVVGRIARFPIYRGEQVVLEKIAGEANQLGLSYIVPPGLRAMSVELNQVAGAGGLVRPGDRVDVIGVMDLPGGAHFATLLAENVEVLAVEQELENRPPGGGQASEGTPVDQPKAQPNAATATLAVTPFEAAQILLADVKGVVRLAVRAPGDATELGKGLAVLVPSLLLDDAQLQKLLDDIRAGTAQAIDPGATR
jgi:pilus assembly protein CpaB